jgi:DNA-binding protein H-NS
MATRKSYPQMLEDLQLLQQQAEAQRRKDVAIVIARIREAMAFWGITEEELGFHKVPANKTGAAAPPPPSPPKKKRKSRYTERPLAGPKN